MAMSLRWQFRTCTIPSRWRVTGALSVLWVRPEKNQVECPRGPPHEAEHPLALHTHTRAPCPALPGVSGPGRWHSLGSEGFSPAASLLLSKAGAATIMLGQGGVRGRAAGSHSLPLSFSQHCPGFCRRKPRRCHGAGPSRPSVATQKHHVQEVRGKALMTALKPDRPSPGT